MVSYIIDGVLELMEYHCSWEYVGYSLDYFLEEILKILQISHPISSVCICTTSPKTIEIFIIEFFYA